MRGAKRTAFGDVSNVVAAKRASKDDSNVLNTKKENHSLQEKKSTFLRPAQRPLSVSGLKNFLIGNSADTVAKVPLNDHAKPSHPSHSKKTLTKKSTTIFKDTSLETVLEDQVSEKCSDSTPTDGITQPSQSTQNTLAVTQLPHKLLLPPPISSDVVDPVKLEIPARSDISLPGIDGVKIDAPGIWSEADTYTVPPATLTQQRQIDVDHEQDPVITQNYIDALPILQEDTVDPVKVSAPQQPHAYVPSSLGGLYDPQPMYDRQELEPYLEEEYDDVYEEEGYVTARSFRSRGEDTTGGATMIFCPPANDTRAIRELEAARLVVETSRTMEDYEDENLDTSMVAEYGEEIFEYMRQQELRMMASPFYMDKQHEIQWSMRAVLMDWLVQVHHRFNLLPETLFLCVNYVDRFLTVKVVSLGKLQLVGATAIFIAAKYEEINCPSVQEIVYMVDGGYSVDEILKAERFMLTMLQFELGFPGPMSFLRRISKADEYDLETRTLAKYFLEVTLMDERFIGSPPSFTAAASHCLARKMLRKGAKLGDWVSDKMPRERSEANIVAVTAPCILLWLHMDSTQAHCPVAPRVLRRFTKTSSGGVQQVLR